MQLPAWVEHGATAVEFSVFGSCFEGEIQEMSQSQLQSQEHVLALALRL
jgi:hypothetical protein